MEEMFNCDVICATISRILSQKHGCKIEFTMTKPNAEQNISDVSGNAEGSTHETTNPNG